MLTEDQVKLGLSLMMKVVGCSADVNELELFCFLSTANESILIAFSYFFKKCLDYRCAVRKCELKLIFMALMWYWNIHTDAVVSGL